MSSLRPHHFHFNGVRDWRGWKFCLHCPLPKHNVIHTVPDPPPDHSAAAAGDHDNDDDLGDE